jgi:hypothetical protein
MNRRRWMTRGWAPVLVVLAACGNVVNPGHDSGVASSCSRNADCDDQLYCNGQERCDMGVCRDGARPALDDGVACTADSCDEQSQAVVHAPTDSICDDQVFCNGAEICTPTGCAAGQPPTCDDSNICTADVCDTDADACDNSGKASITIDTQLLGGGGYGPYSGAVTASCDGARVRADQAGQYNPNNGCGNYEFYCLLDLQGRLQAIIQPSNNNTCSASLSNFVSSGCVETTNNIGFMLQCCFSTT